MKLFEALVDFLKKVYSFLKKPAVKVGVLVVVVVYSGFYLVNQYHELVDTLANLEVNITLLIFVLLLVILTVFMGTLTWRSLLSWLGFHRKWLDAAKGYAYSALAKYIPGFIWQFAGRAYFSDELDIPVKFIGFGIVIELVLTTVVGGALACIAYILSGQPYFGDIAISKFLAPVLTLCLICLLVKLPDLVDRFIQKHVEKDVKLSKKHYFHSVIFNIIGWLLMSFAYYLIIASFGITGFPFISAMFFHTSAFLGGTIAIPFPNGLVVREAILILLGGETLGEHVLVVSSILFRILILISEAVIAILIFVSTRIQKGMQSHQNNQDAG